MIPTRKEASQLLKTPAPNSTGLVLPGECIVRDGDTDAPILLVFKASEAIREACRALCQRTDFSMGVRRVNGLANESQTFGYTQPNALRRRYAPTASRFAKRDPQGHQDLEDAAGAYAREIAHRLPGIAADARTKTSKVDPNWQLGGSWWTSGIINRNTPLMYHRDASNHPAWSAMLVIRWGMRGGHLHLADYDLTVDCADGQVVCFPGHEIVHAVTPFKASFKGAYRYSIVYYPIRYFEQAGAFADALAEGRKRETNMADGLIDRQTGLGLIPQQ